jgi:hypothetical protein
MRAVFFDSDRKRHRSLTNFSFQLSAFSIQLSAFSFLQLHPNDPHRCHLENPNNPENPV